MNKLSFKEKMIATNKFYQFLCWGSPVFIIVGFILMMWFDPYYWYDPGTLINTLFVVGIILLILGIPMIIIGVIIEHKRMKISRQYAAKNPDDQQVTIINQTYNSFWQNPKRKRELTCYVMTVLYPEINGEEKQISSRL